MATRAKDLHVCTDCGFSSPKWFGRCSECGSWNTAARATTLDGSAPKVTTLGASSDTPERFSSGMDEVDRVLGGGLVPGAVVLLAGEPGIGKSTLVLQLLDALATAGRGALLATGEESVAQVGLRARRLGAASDRLRATASTSLGAVRAAADAERPAVLVVDSIQTLEDPDLDGVVGAPTQVRGCATALVALAKASGAVVILVGHVTKDGAVAGPKALEHVVDVVLTLDGERSGALRLLRAAKNRYGSCEETGVFTMGERGLEPVPDPSAMLLADRREGAPGSIVFPGLEGTRPLLVELQALVAPAHPAQARRVAIGLEARRLALLLGVLGQHTPATLADSDVFVAAAGGLAIKEPAADLALALALGSAVAKRPIPPDVVAFGEVGLAGEVRRVPGTERRLAEAARHGFRRVLLPPGSVRAARGLEIVEVRDVASALAAFAPLQVGPSRNGRKIGREDERE